MHRSTALLTVLLVAGCAAAAPGEGVADGGFVSDVTAPAALTPSPAREGRQAPGARLTFVPEEVVLPGGRTVPVDPATTRDGVLMVPTRVDRVGWWDGSSHVGDPYGATVLAGHVDSREEGLGVFADLLRVRVGDLVEVVGDGGRATYRVSAVQDLPKQALASSSHALDQSGPHRLVLITCTGDFDPLRHGYDRNRVVTAAPVGPAAATG